jgi:hypothetical protein
VPYTPNVLAALFLRKTEVAVQAVAHIVAVQLVDLPALGKQLLLQLFGNGGLARARQGRSATGSRPRGRPAPPAWRGLSCAAPR